MIDLEGYYLHNSLSDLNQPSIYVQDFLDQETLSKDQLLICAS
jgi:hypothetical protein